MILELWEIYNDLPISASWPSSSIIWKFLNHILFSIIVNVNTWSKKGWLFGWFRGVENICLKKKKTVRSVKIKTSKYKILELAVLSLGSNVAWFQMKNQTKAGVWYPWDSFQSFWVPSLCVLNRKWKFRSEQISQIIEYTIFNIKLGTWPFRNIWKPHVQVLFLPTLKENYFAAVFHFSNL